MGECVNKSIGVFNSFNGGFRYVFWYRKRKRIFLVREKFRIGDGGFGLVRRDDGMRNCSCECV